MAVLRDLTKFVPSLVIQRLISQAKDASTQTQLPELQEMETVVIFADISGFTNLSERCAARGRVGNEELAFCINRYMENMVSSLNQYGGDIIKFVGDAMIVMWPPISQDRSRDNFEQERSECIRKALQCTQEIQKRLNNQQILPGVTLSVKIGVGYGKCAILYVGGVFNRVETLTVGDALVDALKSEGQASAGGQIYVSESCFRFVNDNWYRSTETKTDRDGHRFYRLDLKFRGQQVKVKADTMKIMSQFSVQDLQAAQKQLEKNVVRCAIPFIKIRQQEYASEIRSLTIMFVNLGVDLSTAADPAGIQKIQQIMVAVQKQVYRLEGAINKLVMDDKGSTLICIFGLPPLTHDDDASRAIFTGWNIINALKKIGNTYCNIGISSGECFCGIVGGSGSRKEFSVLGNIVNISARIMGFLKGQKNMIACDLSTRMMAAKNFNFTYVGHKELKGKSISTPFYMPEDPRRIRKMYTSSIMKYEFFLRPQQNPLILQRNQSSESSSNLTIGFNSLINEMSREIQHYFSDYSRREPYVAVIQGELASGKTVFVRHLFSELKQCELFADYIQDHQQSLPIFASSLNSETRIHFLNAWCSIYPMMVKFYCKRKQIIRHHFIADFILREKASDMANLIIEMTGVDIMQMNRDQKSRLQSKTQIRVLADPIDFVNTPQYQQNDSDRIIKVLTNLFKYCFGDSGEVESEWGCTTDNDGSHYNKLNGSNHQSQRSNYNFAEDPIMICIDNAHLMDAMSWRLLGEITNEQSHVAFFLIMKYDYRDRLLIVHEAKEAFDAAWNLMNQDGKINLRMAEILPLEEEAVKELILRSAEEYRNTHKDEVEDMVKIIDSTNTIKTVEMGVEWKEHYMKQWQLKKLYKDIHPDIVSVIKKNCRGNPYLCLDYFKMMLHNDFIFIDDHGCLQPTEQFIRCYNYEDWTPLVTPQLSKRISEQILSNFLHKPSRNPGHEEQSATAVVLLKTASVLGREFNVDALKYISPLNQDNKRVDDAIFALEKADLIEIIDYNQGRPVRCRFEQTLMHETLYQMVRYKAIKRNVHKKVEEFIQHQPTKMVRQPNVELSEQLLWHMLLAQDCTEEDRLMLERRNALTVLRIQQLVAKKPRDGFILSQQLFMSRTTGLKQNVRSKFLVLKRDQIFWYEDFQQAKFGNYIGYAKLSFIYDTMKVPNLCGPDDTKLWAFEIQISMHSTQSKQDAGRCRITLASESQLVRDKWLAAIDFLKLRAIYESYKSKNSLVNFFMGASEEVKRDGEDDQRDMNELLYDFGGKYKTQSSMAQNIVGMEGAKKHQKGKGSFFYRRGTAIMSDLGSVKPPKATELVEKLRLLYEVSITSFLHQLNNSSLRDKEQVFTSDEEVERMPMQYPNDLTTSTRYEICLLEGLPFDEIKALQQQRTSIVSGRRISMKSKLTQKAQSQYNDKKIEPGLSSVLRKTTTSYENETISIGPSTPASDNLPKGLPRTFNYDEGGVLRSHSLRDKKLHGQDNINFKNKIQQLCMSDSKRRYSSFSEEAQKQAQLDMKGIVEDPDAEKSSSSNESQGKNLANIQVNAQQSNKPRKSETIPQTQTVIKLQPTNTTLANTKSSGQVSDQIALLEERKFIDRSDLSQDAAQHKYEASDTAFARTRTQQNQVPEDNTQNLKDILQQQREKIQQLLQQQIKLQQTIMQQKVKIHERILSPQSATNASNTSNYKTRMTPQSVKNVSSPGYHKIYDRMQSPYSAKKSSNPSHHHAQSQNTPAAAEIDNIVKKLPQGDPIEPNESKPSVKVSVMKMRSSSSVCNVGDDDAYKPSKEPQQMQMQKGEIYRRCSVKLCDNQIQQSLLLVEQKRTSGPAASETANAIVFMEPPVLTKNSSRQYSYQTPDFLSRQFTNEQQLAQNPSLIQPLDDFLLSQQNSKRNNTFGQKDRHNIVEDYQDQQHSARSDEILLDPKDFIQSSDNFKNFYSVRVHPNDEDNLDDAQSQASSNIHCPESIRAKKPQNIYDDFAIN